ncbi:cold-shock Dna-binding domain-containing protein [Cardiosporidium cionae]|uniref:Cold-shock Dna-binding domain-containing protein n=1 Tax=Cardiosporidium cionae TaxID=476202 RepID=A0ABQ7JBW2_9APIC|nr:cold-shock Dna-binding domain-containing protein [Cardiosporidium cionae]|eukprot:KAF8821449.1 cold-shock Dna-binding domain-containing protein [Cardiosporidium cionae]
MRAEIRRGKCKWFNSKKGFGFIITEDNEELFVHQTEIKADGFRNLAENEEVEFEIQEGAEGRRKAVKVTGRDGGCVKGDVRRSSSASRTRLFSNSREYYGGGNFSRRNDSGMGQSTRSHASGIYNWGSNSGNYGEHYSGGFVGGKNFDRMYEEGGGYEVSQYGDRAHGTYDSNGYNERSAIDAHSRVFGRNIGVRRA